MFNFRKYYKNKIVSNINKQICLKPQINFLQFHKILKKIYNLNYNIKIQVKRLI